MKKFKRVFSVVLAVAMVFSLASCQVANDSQRFDQLLASLPKQLVAPNSMDVNFLFNDPAAFGIERELYTLPVSRREDYEQSKKDIEAWIEMLKGYNYQSLTAEQQLSYDILLDYLNRRLLTLDYYELDNSYLGSFIGYQAELPLLFNEYTLNDQMDLDCYFNILKTCKDTFLQYAEIEQERQDAQLGMCQEIMDRVIEQCNTFAQSDNQFLIDSMNEKIDAADFLTDEQKAAAKEQNESLVKNELKDAYLALAESLAAIEVKTPETGLAGLNGGKEYYEKLFRQSTGVDMTIEEVKTYVQGQINKLLTRAVALMTQNPELQTADFTQISYGDFASAEENIAYLGEKMLEDFPSIGQLNFTVKQVPDSMKDNFSPAAYLNSKVDKDPSEPEAIYLNGEYSPDLFTTIAHEGYPGHMYQNVYFKSLNLPTFRYIIGYSGYSEGWATYVENNAWKYAQSDDKALLEFYQINNMLVNCYIALADIGLHYDGWTKEEFMDFFRQNLGGLDEESLNEQYYLNLETPTNYLQYFINGMLYQDLYDETAQKLGSQFDPVAFHEVLLQTGPTSYAILQQQMDAYVSEVTSASFQQAA